MALLPRACHFVFGKQVPLTEMSLPRKRLWVQVSLCVSLTGSGAVCYTPDTMSSCLQQQMFKGAIVPFILKCHILFFPDLGIVEVALSLVAMSFKSMNGDAVKRLVAHISGFLSYIQLVCAAQPPANEQLLCVTFLALVLLCSDIHIHELWGL